MPKTIRRLQNLEIDEVSLVDAAANEHANITFSKAESEGLMPDLYDADGDAVDQDSLESGDVIYDEEGNEFVYLSDEDVDALEAEDDSDGSQYDQVPELVGKGLGEAWSRAKPVIRANASRASAAASGSYAKHPKQYQLGAAGTAVAGTSYAAGHSRGKKQGTERGYEMASKSLGQTVYEELSKAMDNESRDEVIAKAMDEVSKARSEAAVANQRAEQLEDLLTESQYVEAVSGYGLPVDPAVLGPIMKRAAEALPEEDLAVLDRIFAAAGEGMLTEIGSTGAGDSDVMDMIESYADKLIGKNDTSQAEAIVALFDANPAAYDEYLTEQTANGR
jgi:hypothetical protein